MKYFAEIKDDIVVNTVICNDDWDVANFPINDSVYVEYTEDSPAYIGGFYKNNYFYPINIFPSWTMGTTGNWIPPKPMPVDENGGLYFVWNEELQDWEVHL
jgi:hypothetical protein